MASLSLRHIYKIYEGNVQAVTDFNLEIEDKEFIVFVGPSGCGKSTTLRMVAGLEEISKGELYIDNRLVNDVEPKDRDIAMVFQNYALYPHMTVYDNMAFGLKLRKIPFEEIDRRVKEAASILGITTYLSRKPKALSGGQRQRVALGRAIVREPKVFLLDEPLSNLDAKLRVQMRTEITKIHNRLATTFIYVTHDQTEAMTMGSRIVVMKDGFMQQVDTPQNLFDAPCNQFVATFIGTPQMNLIKSKLTREGKHLVVSFGKNKIELPESKSRKLLDETVVGKEVILGVRPEDMHDEEIFINSSPKTIVEVEVDVTEKLGSESILYTHVDGKEDYCVARVDARSTAKPGDKVKLAIDANHIHLFDPETELALLTLPLYNYYEARLKSDNNNLVAQIGKATISLTGVVNKLTKRNAVGTTQLVGVNPFKVDIDGQGDMSMDGVISFVEENTAYKIVYAQIEGMTSLSALRAPLSFTKSKGDSIKVCFNEEAVMAFDIESGEKLISYGEVPKYNISGSLVTITTASSGEQRINVSFGTAKFKIPESKVLTQSVESATVAVAPEKFVYAKGALAGKIVIKVKVDNVDKISNYTLVYAHTEEKEEFNQLRIVAKLDAACRFAPGDKVKIGFDTADVELLINNDESILKTPECTTVCEKTVEVIVPEEPIAPVAEEVVEAPVAVETEVPKTAEVVEAPKAKKPAAKKAAPKKEG